MSPLVTLYIIALLSTIALGANCGTASVTSTDTGFTGALSQPLPYDGVAHYNANTTCTWDIYTSTGLAINVTFNHINLACGDTVKIKYGGIYGVTITWNCTDVPDSYLIPSSHITVVFAAAFASPTDVGFAMSYEMVPYTQCIGSRYFNGTTSPHFEFSNPTPWGNLTYSYSYYSATNCYYYIETAPGTAIRLNVTGLDIPSGTLALSSSTGQSLGNIPYNTPLGTTFWASSYMQLTWSIGTSAYLGKGWRVNYDILPDDITPCDFGMMMTGTDGLIQPYTPFGGGVGLTVEYSYCSWLITVEFDSVVTVNVPWFSLGGYGNGAVTFYDSTTSDYSKQLLYVPGTQTAGVSVSSTKPYMYVTFSGYTRQAGFNATWEATEATVTTPCAPTTMTTATTGTIGSSVPLLRHGSYPGNASCSWLLYNNYGWSVVSLTFLRFDLGENDWVLVYDGSDATAPLIANFSGAAPLTTVNSTDLSMFVVFQANNYNVTAGQGFIANFARVNPPEVCGCSNSTPMAIAVPDGGVVRFGVACPYSSSSYYALKTQCKWYLYNPSGKALQIRFPDLDTVSGRDFVQVYDGATTSSSQLLGAFSGSSGPGASCTPTYYLNGAYSLTVLFNATYQYTNYRNGFLAQVTTTDYGVQCFGAQTLTASSGTINMPRNATGYAPDLACSWLIMVPKGYVVQLTVAMADIASDDRFIVADGDSAEYAQLFSGQLNTPFMSSTRFVMVAFTSNAVNQAGGFTLSYSAVYPDIECQNNFGGGCLASMGLTASSDPDYIAVPCPYTVGSTYTASASCTFVMTAPVGQIVQMKLLTFDMASSDSLTIYDGNYNSYPYTTLDYLYYSDEASSIPYLTTGNVASVRFSTSSSSTRGRGWVIQYQAVPNPGTMCDAGSNSIGSYASGGTISSSVPYGQGNYTQNLDCEWFLQVDSDLGTGVTFYLTDLDLGPGDTLTIYDCSCTSDEDNLLAIPTQAGGAYSSSGRYLTIRFQSNIGPTGLGFRGYWKMTNTSAICNVATTLTAMHLPASLSVPAYSVLDDIRSYPPMTNCSWLIQPASALDMVYITFMNLNLGAGDSVVIWDEPSITGVPVATLQNYITSSVTYTTNGKMRVVFTSDMDNNGGGFKFHYSSGYPEPCGGGCTSAYSTPVIWNNDRPYGLIGAPCPYGPFQTFTYSRTTCQWKITGSGNGISYRLLNYSDSYDDDLKLYLGSDTSAPLVSLGPSALGTVGHWPGDTIFITYTTYSYTGVVIGYDTGGQATSPAPTWANPPPPPPSSTTGTYSGSYASSYGTFSTTDDNLNAGYVPITSDNSGGTFIAIFFGAFFGGSFLIVGIVLCIVFSQKRRAARAGNINRAPAAAPITQVQVRPPPPSSPAPPPVYNPSPAVRYDDRDESGPPVRANEVPMKVVVNEDAPPAYADIAPSTSSGPPPTSASLRCRQCQSPLVPGGRFCQSCGTPMG